MQDGFGENNAYSHKSGIDKYLISEYYYMFQYLGVKDTTEVQDIMFSNEDDLYAFYALSSSFVDYIIEKYSIENFMSIYISEMSNSNYLEVYGVTREHLVEEWMQSIDNTDNEGDVVKGFSSNDCFIKLVYHLALKQNVVRVKLYK